MCKITFEEFGRATWPIDQAIYAYPLKMAIRLNIPLVVYGENISWEYGGVLSEETYSAKDQINNTVAKKYGFKDLNHRWIREGYIDNYDQIDSVGYLMNSWLKYPKFGFQRTTDLVGYWIRGGRINKEEGIKLIKKK